MSPDAAKRLVAGQKKLLAAAARGTDYQLWMRCYCESQDCTAREIEIRVKDYDSELVTAFRGFKCPLCGSLLNLHSVRTSQEHELRDRADARSSVTRQMYERDEKAKTGDGLVLIPLGIFMNDQLPPTPDGWWERSKERE